MRKTFEVIDDFYRNPMDYREQALKILSLAQRGEKTSTNGSLDSEPVERIFRILGWGSNNAPHATICGYFTFRDKDIRDPLAMQLEGFSWAGFVCLSLTERCSSDIWFYRREQSPLRDFTETTLDGLGHLMVNQPPAVDAIQSLKQTEACQPTIHLSMRFNRLVLFHTSELGHGVSSGFENIFESELLIQVIAFSEESVCR
jgi:hypothetical protein